MEICRNSLAEIIEKDIRVIGFYGAPPREALEAAARQFPLAQFFDLDIFFDAPQNKLLPDAYCHIIRNCVDNALAAKHQLLCVVAATGEEKCDAGRYAARLLSAHLDGPVISTTNTKGGTPAQPLLCEAKGSLKQRAVRIMESIIEPLSEQERSNAFISRCEPTVGFWGTPPHPIEVLDLFPPTTHIFGWTRCVEQNTPADLNLEMTVNESLPTVYFAQGFCAKALLARDLAQKTGGMFVDTHDTLGAATMAKIEAFIRLS
ncbi:MAG: hypothetical protein JXX29_09180 [Deltaproteobacteria bacterium]|nr:hypothetical protein [Deltaproteobacteria bacterium]MBN2671835.1 hypothetical protein [Deltaproteobacteria bacterium]